MYQQTILKFLYHLEFVYKYFIIRNFEILGIKFEVLVLLKESNITWDAFVIINLPGLLYVSQCHA